jgi:hypothetical protein
MRGFIGDDYSLSYDGKEMNHKIKYKGGLG